MTIHKNLEDVKNVVSTNLTVFENLQNLKNTHRLRDAKQTQNENHQGLKIAENPQNSYFSEERMVKQRKLFFENCKFWLMFSIVVLLCFAIYVIKKSSEQYPSGELFYPSDPRKFNK